MQVVLILLLVLFVVLILYVFSTICRQNHPELPRLRGWNYAHRGLHNAQICENSISAFRHAINHRYGIEFDVHLLADGHLAVMHDSTLKRMTGKTGILESLTVDQLPDYHLLDSTDVIPTLEQVLALCHGQVPLIIELKTYRGNAAALCQAVCQVLDTYTGTYCLESFDPRCIRWLRLHRPDLIRGQLTENYLKSSSDLPWILKVIMTLQMENFLTRPDFIACRINDCGDFSQKLVRRLWKAQGVTWTVPDLDTHKQMIDNGWISIFEGFMP